jgi:hypothetical protein
MGTTQNQQTDQRFSDFASANYSQRLRTEMGVVNKFVLPKGLNSIETQGPVRDPKKAALKSGCAWRRECLS